MSILMGKKIIGLLVESESGEVFGRIRDFELDLDSQSILKYYVKGDNLIKKLTSAELVIHRSQVIFIDSKKMIVKDTVIAEEVKRGGEAPMPAM